MRRLWLLLLPCLFLPDFGVMSATNVGAGEFADYLIGPYLLLVYFGGRRQGMGDWRRHKAVLIGLLAWALLSTLTINLRYGYSQPDYVLFGLVKLGKLAAYGSAGILTTRALETDVRARLLFPWALLAICLVVSIALISFRGVPSGPRSDAPQLGFMTRNGISVALAILYCWMTAYWLGSTSSHGWCVALAVASPVLLVGFFFTDGRGGWVAAIVGVAFTALRFGVRPAFVVPLVIGAATVLATYHTEEGFRVQVDMTLDPSRLRSESEFASSTGIDDGSRIDIWTHEAQRIFDSPALGAGLFHRGARSRLWPTGSHNFWLQMFLELGLVGGTLMLVAFRRMWQSAGSRWAESAGVSIPVRAALLAGFVGGMSGEYFYGGKPLFALLLAAAPALSLPFEALRQPHLPVRTDSLRPVSGTA